MKPEIIRRSLLLGFVSIAATASADEAASSATLPLDTLLKLHQQLEAARKPGEPAPPLAASVDKLELTGRLFDDGIELRAHFDVTVLSDGSWSTLSLLKMDPRLSIAELPEIEGAALVRQGADLVLVTRKASSYSFELALIAEAQREGRRRAAQLAYPGATAAVMRIQFDETLFRIIGSQPRKSADAYVLYPKKNEFALTWERVASAESPAAMVTRPPVQPLIERAHASVVSTLEGEAIVRLLYHFRCEQSQAMELVVPERQQLQKVFLNGARVPFFVKDRTLQLNVEPTRAGDQSGQLELVLAESLGRYHLAGALQFEVPRISWPVNEMYLQLNLPPVFHYKRIGGSMEEVESGPSVEFTQRIPTPGKSLTFHQFLIASSAPRVELSYEVELAGMYFR